MEVKVKIGGMDATITVATAQEAAELLRSIASLAPPSPEPIRSPDKAAAESEGNGYDESRQMVHYSTSAADNRTELQRMEDGLRTLKGSKAAKVLMYLAQSTEFTPIGKIREMLGVSPESNVGPMFANISKAVRSQGLRSAQVLKRHVERPAQKGGQFLYFFRLTASGRKVVNSFKDFDKKPEIPKRSDDEMDEPENL